MAALRLSTPAFAVALLLASACGGGGSGPNPPPPPPPTPGTVAKQAGDNQTAEPGQPVPIPPAVKVTTSAGAALSGVAVTFAVASGGGSLTGGSQTTGADGVATVGSWTLGDALGANTLTASVTATGVSGNPATFTATGQLGPFSPTANTSLTGTRRFTTVTIPAGVTITMTGDLTLNATGAVTIAGNIVGDCKALTINAEGALTVSGNLNTGCPGAVPATGPPAMTLVGKGGWTLEGPGGFTAPGDVTITDDPTATDADFAPSPGAAGLRARSSAAATPCVYSGFTGTPIPATMPPNDVAGSPNGVKGGDGSLWTLRCKGGPDIVVGSLSLTGQNGGKGGDGSHSHATAAVSRGGNGGKGGTVKIQAFRNITIGGGLIRTGNGGAGGNAEATGTGGGGNVGASADATGGAGATPGLFGATAKTGAISFTGALTLQIGNAGRGGNATAKGADGHDAPPCPAAVGGPAIATAGDGGSTPDKALESAGAVTGAGNVTVTGGTPGEGGAAVATAGKGGAGAQPCKPGAIGGAPTAKGGKGGDADLKNVAGIRIANGANGGRMEVKDGKGGQGWNDCILPVFEEGGVGGKGGSIAGSNGARGTGLANGVPGSATFTTVANAGNGGDGLPPGAGGAPGGNGVILIGGVVATIVDPSFQPGNPGNPCPSFTMAVSPPSQTAVQGATITVRVTIIRVGGFTGPVAIEVKDPGGAVRGAGTIPTGSTQVDVSVTIPANETLGGRNYSVMGTGTGVPIQTEILALTILAPSSIAIVSATPNTPTVTQGGTGSVAFQIARNSFTGNVAVILKDEGGNTRGSTTVPGPGGTNGSLIYNVPSNEPTGPRTWVLMAMGSGVADASLNYPIVVSPPAAPATVDVDLNTMPHTGNVVPFGTHTLNLTVSNQLRGTIQIVTVFTSGNHFWSNIGSAGLRVGSGNGNGFRALLNTAMVDGTPYVIAGYGYCLRNGTGLDTMNPVVINQRDTGGNIINTTSVTSLPNGNAGPLCQWATILPNATSIEILAPVGAGRFIDSGSWQLWR